jgi:uncharacterized phage protein gp47/JayE
MSANVPSSKELYDEIIASLEAELASEIPIYRKAFLRVLSVVLSGVIALLYRVSNALALDFFPQTATDGTVDLNGSKYNPLELLRVRAGVEPRQAAIPARHEVTISFTSAEVLNKGSFMVGDNNKIVYITEDVATVSEAGTTTVSIIALEDGQGNPETGASGTLQNGDLLTIKDAPSYVSASCTSSATLRPGEDAETSLSFRTRVVEATQASLHGGALNDIKQFAKLVPQVTRVFPYTGMLPGSVDVYVEVSDQTDGIPTTEEIELVEKAIRFTEIEGVNFADRSDANLLPIGHPISMTSFSVEIDALTGVNSLAYVQVKCEQALYKYFQEREPDVPGLTEPPKKNLIATSSVSGIVQGVVQYYGGSVGDVVVKDSTGEAVATYVLSEGELCKLTGVTWL